MMLSVVRMLRFEAASMLINVLLFVSLNCPSASPLTAYARHTFRTFNQQSSQRWLEEYDNSTFAYDITDFSVRFEKCQLVQMFDDELASQAYNQEDSPFAVMHFVVYRLCPTSTCTKSSKGESCGSVYGTYTLDVKSYLESTIEYQRQEFEAMCNKCDEECDEEAGASCSGCGKLCWQYANLEASGYVDAANYIQCQQLNIDKGEDDEEAVIVYAGPRCSKSGTQIRIGLFADANCLVPIENLNITTVLGATLSYHLLANTYSTTDNYCLSCAENVDEEGDNMNDKYDADNVNEMCEKLYNGAAKCESDTGLTNGFIQTARDRYDEEYNRENNNKYNYNQVNQVENEFMACTFIQSLIWDSYNQQGEINYLAQQDVIVREVTKNQRLYLSLVSATFVTLLALMYYLQRKIREATISGAKGEDSVFI